MARDFFAAIVVLAVIAFIVYLLSGYFDFNKGFVPHSSVNPAAVWHSGDSEAMRYFTATQCRGLLGKPLTLKGVVVGEECGKNCLGGCPNSGPAYCHYAIRDERGCVVFVASRIDSYPDDRFAFMNKVYSSHAINEAVEVEGTPALYFRPYCNNEYCNEINPTTSAFTNASYRNSSWCEYKEENVEAGEFVGFVNGVPECTYFVLRDFPRDE